MKDKLIFKTTAMRSITTIYILFVLCISSSYAQDKKFEEENKKIYLNIHFPSATKNDTLYLYTSDDILFSLLEKPEHIYTATSDEHNDYKFEISTSFKKSGYFILLKSRNQKSTNFEFPVRMMDYQYWELGDSLNIDIVSFRESPLGGGANCLFSGKGSEKYNLANQIDHLELDPNVINKISGDSPPNWKGNILDFKEFDSLSTYTTVALDLLEKHKQLLTEGSFNIIKASIIYKNTSGLFSAINMFGYNGSFNRLDSISKREFIEKLTKAFDYPDNYNIQNKDLANSLQFIRFLTSKIISLSYLNTGKFDLDYIYKEIKTFEISDEIKEILIIKFLSSPMRNSKNPLKLYNDAGKFIKTPTYLNFLDELKHKAPGRKFTDFKLKDASGKIRSLAQFKNKIVLIDFWFTGCGHCENYYKDILSPVKKHFTNNKEVVFLSISIDRDKNVWLKSILKGSYTSTESINLYTNGQQSKHPIITKNNISSFPTVILLKKAGQIKFFNSPNLYSKDSLIKSIQDLIQTH